MLACRMLENRAKKTSKKRGQAATARVSDSDLRSSPGPGADFVQKKRSVERRVVQLEPGRVINDRDMQFAEKSI